MDGCHYGDFYNAWKIVHVLSYCMDIWKMFQNSFIHISCHHNDETVKISWMWIAWNNLDIRCHYSANCFLHFWLEFLFQISLRLLKIIEPQFTKLTFQDTFHIHMFAFMLCVDLMKLELLWGYKGITIHVFPENMHIFCKVFFFLIIWFIIFLVKLSFVVYQNKLIVM